MTVKKKEFWQRGIRSQLAAMADVKIQHLSEILHRRRGVGTVTAERLERASLTMLGSSIPMREWLLNRTSSHPAFFGKPKRS